MGEVVGGPGGDELPRGHTAEGGVGALPLELFACEAKALQLLKVGGAKAAKLIEQGVHRFALGVLQMGLAIEGVERAVGTVFEDDGEAWHPVGLFRVVQMPDDVAGAPCAGLIDGVGPGIGLIAEECIENCRGAGEDIDRLLQEGFAHLSMVARASALAMMDVMDELVFEAVQEADGGLSAECLTESIFTQADSWQELRQNVVEAINAFYFDRAAPASVRLHLVRDGAPAVQ